MSMITDKKHKQDNNCKQGQELVDVVFSWSLADVLNRKLYKEKVTEIPKTFPSVTDYKMSFVNPLFEETHADLLSKILGVNRCPTAKIVRVETSSGFKPPKELLYTIFLNRCYGSYEPQFGDLIALTDVRPKSVDDLKRPNKSYTIAIVQRVKIENSVYKTFVLSSKPINQQEVGSVIEKNLISYTVVNDVKHFVVFLTNLTTNIRISKALHSELEGEKKKMIENLLQVDTSVEESCAECCIDETRDILLSKVKENLKLLHLDSSQEGAVLSCVAERDCRHRNTIKLIWGPPGTGKTKTIGSLLFMLLRMKCRTLTCAPTNIAVLGVSKRVMNLVRDSLVYDTYGLGDIVLFGNEERMKIGDHQDLSDIFLSFRVKSLTNCLAPCSGWKGSSAWMISFLEDPEDAYRMYLMEKSVSVERESHRNKDDNEESIDSHVKKALKHKNWKALVVNELPEKQKSGKRIFHEDILSFEQFVTKGFGFLGNHLISCVVNLYTHMPTSFISVEAAKQMIGLVRSLRLMEQLLKQTVVGNVGLREALKGQIKTRRKKCNLHACRMSSLEILKYLKRILYFPEFKKDFEVKLFCMEKACLIFCTASSSINLHTNAEKPLEFLVIDEAAQLKECESLIPLQLDGLRHAILVGDERQLPAMVESEICKEAEFGRSLFERLVILGHKKHLLNVQYRMHPSISLFPNTEFYDKQILDGVNVKNIAYGKRFLQGRMYGSYSFINVTSAKEEFDRNQSRLNLLEVSVAADIIASLFKEAVARRRRVSVGCISPYKAQVNALQEKLGNKYVGRETYFSVNVRSVDGFQGSEEDIIIISTVRCNGKGSIGFLSNHQRTNVALTRARYCLWILGNASTLLNSGSIWKKLIVDAKERGCFYNASEDNNSVQAAMGDGIPKHGSNEARAATGDRMYRRVSRVAQPSMADHCQLNSIFKIDPLIFRESNWQVKFSDMFVETISRFTDPEIRKEVTSFLVKLSSGWRQPQKDVITAKANMEGTYPLLTRITNFEICKEVVSFLGRVSSFWSQPQKDENAKLHMEETCPLLEKYNVTQDLCLIWAVDIVVQDSHCIQVLKIWDILPSAKIQELEKLLMERVYGNYSENMMSRCKEKCVNGNLMLPITWRINSDNDPFCSLVNPLAALSLKDLPALTSSSRVSSGGEVCNRKCITYDD